MPRQTKTQQITALADSVAALLEDLSQHKQALAGMMRLHGLTCACEACALASALVHRAPRLATATTEGARAGVPVLSITPPLPLLDVPPAPAGMPIPVLGRHMPTLADIQARILGDMTLDGDDLAQLQAMAALQQRGEGD